MPRQRILTALILMPLLLAAVIWLPLLWLAIVLGLVALLAAGEWARLTGLESSGARAGFVLAVGILGAGSALWLLPGDAHWLALAASVAWLAGLPLIVLHESGYEWRTPVKPALACVGIVMLVPAWLSLLALRNIPEQGVAAVVFLFVLIWLADSAAYFSGRYWGRRRLAPRTSPGKTLAGLVGALVAVLILALLSGYLLGLQPIALAAFVALVIVTTGFSVLGDLLESLFKRRAGVKDSGNLLPGHGGILDRIDSLLAAAPVFLAGLWILERVA